MIARFFSLVLLVWLVGCSSNELVADGPYRLYESVTVDGHRRSYLLNLPPDYYDHSDRFPLVVALHGTGGDAAQFERSYGFSELADSAGFVAVYPEGIPSEGLLNVRTWNAGACCGPAADRNVDDVAFIAFLVESLIDAYRIDPGRIYVTGMSNGGMLAYRLACTLSEKIAAVAVVSGTMVEEKACSPSRPIPVLHLHSVQDTIVPYEGGVGLGGYTFAPIDSVLAVWSSLNRCDGAPTLVDQGAYSITRWTDCEDDATVEVYITDDGGHAWPGGHKVRPRADTPSTVIDANELIWDFFQRFETPGM